MHSLSEFLEHPVCYVGQWAMASVRDFMMSLGWVGLAVIFMGGVLLLSLWSHLVRLARSPKGMGVCAAAVAIGLGWLWYSWPRPAAALPAVASRRPATAPAAPARPPLKVVVPPKPETPPAVTPEEPEPVAAPAPRQATLPVWEVPEFGQAGLVAFLRSIPPRFGPLLVTIRAMGAHHAAARAAKTPVPVTTRAATASVARPRPAAAPKHGIAAGAHTKPGQAVLPAARQAMTPAQQRRAAIRESNRIALLEYEAEISGYLYGHPAQQGVMPHAGGHGHAGGQAHMGGMGRHPATGGHPQQAGQARHR